MPAGNDSSRSKGCDFPELQLPSGKLGGSLLNERRALAVEEARAWPTGVSQAAAIRTRLYKFRGGHYTLGVAKPGKEAFIAGPKLNAYDMLPFVELNGTDLGMTPSFRAIFRTLWDASEDARVGQLFGPLLFRNAYMLDHVATEVGLRYAPLERPLKSLAASLPTVSLRSGAGNHDLPVTVFLGLLEVLALNEDVKYRSHDSWKSGVGRVKTLMTCVNVVVWKMTNVHPMDAGGRLVRGVAPVTQKQAFELFPCLGR